MEMKHTPGPWRVVGPYIACDAERVVAKFCDNNDSGPVWVGTPAEWAVAANGKLLAAAPDLLAACRLMVSATASDWKLEGKDDEYIYDTIGSSAAAGYFAARAAIAKATS